MSQVNYPAKTRSAKLDSIMPPKTRSAAVNETTRGLGKPPSGAAPKKGNPPKKGALRGGRG